MNSGIRNSPKKRFSIEDIIFWVMLGFAFPLPLKTSLTNTGMIYVNITMFIYLLIGLYFFKVIFQGEKQETKIIINYLTLCVWYGIVLIYRYFAGGTWHASLLIVFWSIIPVAFYILILVHAFDIKRVCTSLYWSMTFLNLFSCIYSLIIIRSLRTDFLGNINMVVYFSVLGMFIYTFYYLNINSKTNKFVYIFNMSYSVSIVLFSGSRAGVLTGILTVVLLVLLHNKNKRVMKAFGVVGLITIVLLFLALTTNFYGSKSMFFRGVNWSTFSESLDISKENKNTNIDTKTDDFELNQLVEKASVSGDAEQVLILNDVGRIMMWENAIKEIKKAPLIGTGVVGVYKTKDGSQLPHNVILEYWLAYGGIGLLLWVVLAIQVLYKAYNKVLNDRKRFFLILAYVIVAMTFSMVEPTMSNTFGAFLFWCGIGIFSLAEENVQ